MNTYTPKDIAALTNWDNMLYTPPHKNDMQRKQYYARYINRMLWRYLTNEDWKHIERLINEIKVDEKLKTTTRFLIKKRRNPRS